MIRDYVVAQVDFQVLIGATVNFSIFHVTHRSLNLLFKIHIKRSGQIKHVLLLLDGVIPLIGII